MSRAQQLYELQVADLDADVRAEELARVESQLQEPQWLVEARERVRFISERAKDLERRERALQWNSDDLRAKVAELEEKLYGGRVRNPKELSGLQHEADAFTRQRGTIEDSLLELMLEQEEIQHEFAAATAALDQMESHWRAERGQLEAEQQRLARELESLTARRDQLMARIPEPDRQLYTLLRQERGGRAVSRVERNMCSGCRIAMSSVEIHRARTSLEPLRCASCGRVLYVP